MKKLLFFLSALLFTVSASFAQNSIMAGRIVDDNNAPINGAEIRVSRGGQVMAAHSDEDGLFYTQLLPVGNYHMDVIIGKTFLKTKMVYLGDNTKKRSYYYLKVTDNKLRITVDGQDPFLKSKLSKIEKDDYNIIDGIETFYIDRIVSYPLKNEDTVGINKKEHFIKVQKKQLQQSDK